jgi:CBS domain-containing protein
MADTDAPIVLHTPLALRARTARDLMTPAPVCVFETDPLETAAELLARFSAVPVVDVDRRCVGVISRTDLARFYGTKHAVSASLSLEARSPDPLESTSGLEWKPVPRVSEAMTGYVVTTAQDALAGDVVASLRDKRIGRVFVTDSEFHLIGVISTTDIIAKLAAL